MKKFLLTLLSFFSLTVLFAQGQVSISGTVIDEETNETIIGALVTSDSTNKVITDADGRYTIFVSPNSTHVLEVSAMDYETQSVSIAVGTSNITKDFVVVIFTEGEEIDEV